MTTTRRGSAATEAPSEATTADDRRTAPPPRAPPPSTEGTTARGHDRRRHHRRRHHRPTAPPPPEGSAAPAVENPAVGLLYDVTGRGDKSFNDSAAAGLDAAKESVGATGTESTPTSDSDRAERMENMLGQDLDLVIGVGFLWGADLQAAALANPDQLFGAIDSVAVDPMGTPDDFADDVPLQNVASMTFAEEQGSFLVGAAAALKSESGTIGFIGGVETTLIKKFEAGYTAGAQAVNPDIEILTQYITQPPDFTGFNDPAKGKEIAASMYGDGADVVYAAAGGSGNGVAEAASEAGEAGTVWTIGVDSDFYNLVDPALQPYVLTSMLKKVDVAVQETIEKLANGEFRGGQQVFDLAGGGVDYSTTGGFVDDIADQLDDFKQQIIDGEIEVPTEP